MKLLGRLLVFLVRVYQRTISPVLGANCRYRPTCSGYMVGAIEEWGPVKGTWLGLRRIGRCHPWGGHGFDPVPRRGDEPTLHSPGDDPDGPHRVA